MAMSRKKSYKKKSNVYKKRTTKRSNKRSNKSKKHVTKKRVTKKRSTKGKKRSTKNKTKSTYLSSWSAPKSQRDRRSFKERCGSKCFLRPQDLKFPICSSNCEPQCNGLLSAYIRAKQWNYNTEALKARHIGRQNNCGWALRQKD